MWKPNYVVTEHRKRAILVWAGLLLTIVGFVVWQLVSLVKAYANPSTSFEVSDDVYRFPTMEVCFWGFHGCDWDISSCIESVNATISDTCGTVWDVRIDSPPESKDCVTFDLEQVETEDFAASCNASVRPYIDLKMVWYTSDETGGEDSFSSRVSVYLGGADVQEVTWVPYSRVVFSDEESGSEVRIAETHMSIGKSTRTYLSSSPVISYPTLKISTTDYIYRNQAAFLSDSSITSSFLGDSTSIAGGEPSIGYLFLNVNLGRFSLTKLSDDNPIDMLDFIANIGGFWEVLLLVWGVFFIATVNATPEQQARNFDKPIQMGKGLMRMKRPSPPPAVDSDAVDGSEQQPNWDVAHGGPLQATGNSNGGTVSAK